MANMMEEAFPDGVIFVPLAPISDPNLVPSAIIAPLGVREAGDEPLIERLKAVLRNKRLLLVLDNFEHVIEASPIVADVLETCPGVTVLVTSRVRLRISGERELPIAPLGLAAPDRHSSAADVATSDAVRLFVARAEAVHPDFALTPENAVDVAEICRRLDGLPLAIELAAARVKVLPPSALLARLDHRLPLLTGGGRDVPARQQTMRNAIAWSHDLLSPEEQVLFRRLAVFAGGFTLEAAEAVVSGSGELGIDPLEGVASLLDKSLLRQEAGPGGEPRFTMLETVREFALGQLAASGEEAAVSRAHGVWYLDLADRSFSHLIGATDVTWLERVDVEHANLRAGLSWFAHTDDAIGLLRCAGALWAYWHLRSHRREARGWLERALTSARDVPDHDVARLRALHGAGMLAQLAGDSPEARERARECLDLARAQGDRWHTAAALELLGYAAMWDARYPEAVEFGTEALGLFQEVGDCWFAAMTQTDVLGMAAVGQGDLDRAETIFEEALTVYRDLADPYGTGQLLGYLGLTACARGDRSGAATRFSESLQIWQRLGNRENQADWLASVATLATASGSPERAARLFGTAEALRESLDHASEPPLRAMFMRAMDATRSALGTTAFAEATSAGRVASLAQAVDDAAAFLAAVVGTRTPTNPPGAASDPTLTPRELDVLRLLVEGRSDREIGEALFIGTRTVQTHAANLFAKLGVNARAEAAAVAVRRGLV
jgi:predicted ATPase/DNA-binding CsgD family transcriptional regulator